MIVAQEAASTAGTVFETADVEQARDYMCGVFRTHHLHAKAHTRLALRHQSFCQGRLSLHWLRYGAGVTMSAPEMERFYLFQFTLGGQCQVTHGRDVMLARARQAYAVDPSRPLSKTWAEDCEQLIVKVDREHLEGFALRETGVEATSRLAFRFVPVEFASGPRGLVSLLDAFRSDGCTARGLGHHRVGAHLEPTIMSLLLAGLPHSLEDEFDRAASPCPPYYVRRAEQFMRAHARDPVTMAQLVDASGVSARSLFNGFKRFRETTPMGYLKAIRLELARADLRGADPAEATVTDIAIGCGFSHMSKFARDFRRRFGVNPALMLKRAGSA